MAGNWIVGLGLATIDYLATLPAYPEKNSKNRMTALSTQGGGPAATAMAAAARLGERARFVGKVGDDDFGRQILDGLQSVGVDVRKTVVEKGAASPFSFVAIDARDASRTIFHWRDIAPLRAEEVDWSCLEGAGVLLADQRQMEAQLVAARRCRERGIPVLLDAEAVREGTRELAALTDVLIGSEDFAREILPSGSDEERVRAVAALGPRTAIITLGERGSIGLCDGAVVRQAAFPVKAVDTTGCGDAFHGAYAVALVRGYDLRRCLEFASAVAALNTRAVGGRAGLPTQAEVDALLAHAER